MRKIENVEILYVNEASDQRGRRVLIREGGCENTIWPDEGVQNVDIDVLGITPDQQRQIRNFLDIKIGHP